MLLIIRCRHCHTALSNRVHRVAWSPLPRVKGREHYSLGPSTVAAGRFSSAPEHFGARGTSHMTIVINSSDGVQLRHHTEPARLYGCCGLDGLDGLDGPNLLCGVCGTEVGFEISDCWTEHDDRLLCTAVVEEYAGTHEPFSSAG